MKQWSVQKPLPLSGAHNVRDLGGYPARGGRATNYKQFLRGDSLAALTGQDRQALANYGVTLVIDLRGGKETSMRPDSIDREKMEYLNVPLLDQIQSQLLMGKMPEDMGEMYVALVENSKDELRTVFARLAAARACALYHCTAGKDRTGVVTMLLLGLAGVPDEIVLADYSATEGYMKDTFDSQKKMVADAGIKVPDYVFQSRPEYMEKLIRHVTQNYGGAEGYLRAIGLDAGDIAALQGKLVG